MRLSHLPVVALASMLPALALACRDYAPSYERRPAKLEVYDRTGGHTLPIYMHDGRMYVAGEPGHQYELRLSNRSNQRMLAVTSVDGVNVISGETADSQQSGYVLDPWADLSVEGWRKSMDEVATFYFTRLSKSYAARTGRPHDVGVIGVAVFREHGPRCRDHFLEQRADAAPEAPLANADVEQDSASASSPQRAREKLGTGHGHRETSRARYVDFQRASSTPDETIVIYYDSRKNLVAQGVIRDRRHYAEERRQPNPFPNELFVPDP